MTSEAPVAKVLEIDTVTETIRIDGKPIPWAIFRDWVTGEYI